MDDDYCGEILFENNLDKVDSQRFVDFIRDHPNLAPIPPRKGINPFTKEVIVIKPRADSALMVVDGETVGSIEWAHDGSDKIIVWGESVAVHPLAVEIARALGGRYERRRSG